MTRRLRLTLLLCLAIATPAFAQGGFPPNGFPTAGALPSMGGGALGVGVGGQDTVGAYDYRIAQAAETMASETERRDRLQVEFDSLAQSRDELERQVTVRGRALYRVRRAGLLPVAGGFDAMLAHLSRVERLERMVRSDIRALRTTRERQIAIQRDIRRLDQSVEEATQTVARLRAERERLAEQQRLAMVYQSPYGAGTLPMAPVAPLPNSSYGMQTATGSFAPTFQMMRGRLGIPTSGSYRTVDVRRDDGPAVEFRTEGEAPAKVVADGSISYVGRYGSYGLMVIVDHGDSYFTVYAQLANAEVRVGDAVRMGQRVGIIGSSPMLFQVRQGTRALDARNWLGL